MPQQQNQDSTSPVPLAMEEFAGINTATTRTGVPDKEMYWCDGFFPLAPGNLRTLYGIGPALYTATGGKTIICFYFYNLGPVPYAILFLSDGSAIQVNTANGTALTVLAATTIANPSITQLGVTQYGSQYLVIVADQSNGYWVWDGSILYTAGTLGPQIVLTSGGSGYTSVPNVIISGGLGTGAAVAAQIADGFVTNAILISPGSGYQVGDAPVVTFSGGTSSGSGATLTAIMTSSPAGSGASASIGWINAGSQGLYYVSGYSITAPGSGYTQFAQAAFNLAGTNGGFVTTSPPFTTISPVLPPGIVVTLSAGAVSAIAASPPVADGANGIYWRVGPGAPAFPTISFADSGGAYVSGVSITSHGSGYNASTAITAAGGSNPIVQATFKPIISGGSITAATILNGGLYGSVSPSPTLTVTDTKSDATATVSIMPYGIQGTAVANYQGHVWVFNGDTFNFSAPGSVSDFATSAGGGSDQSSASYLKVGYTQAVSTNGFLFLIGDSSMDYISGVQTTTPSGGLPTTNFTQNNCDPEVGTPYAAAVTTLGQEILLANSAGIFVSSGGAFVKQSEPLDGVYNTVPATNFNALPFAGAQISAAKATIFGKRVWMVLAPIVDPVAGVAQSKLLMYNGKYWWTSLQDVVLEFIQGQEINSVFTAWGTDGTHLFPLFQQPSNAFAKTVRSKLWLEPGGYESGKAVSRFWSIWDVYDLTATGVDVDIDAIGIDSNGAQYTNTQTYPVLSGLVSTGYYITQPMAVGQQGVAVGMTIITNATDAALVSAKIAVGDVQSRG